MNKMVANELIFNMSFHILVRKKHFKSKMGKCYE